MIAPAKYPPTVDDIGFEDPDACLMMRVRDGDHEALQVLHERYHSRLIGLITHMMGNNSLAEDLAQQVFLQVFRGRARYTPSAQFSTWLFTITRNVVFNARRSLSRRRETGALSTDSMTNLADGLSSVSTELDPLEAILQHELQISVRGAIEQLGDLQQQAVRLVCLRGYRYRAAAEQMQVTEDSVRQLVHRGKGKLRNLLQNWSNADLS